MDRKTALAQGLKTYTGKPCKRCSTSEKYVNNWGCVLCSKTVHQPSAEVRKRYEKSDKGRSVRKKINRSDNHKERLWEYNNNTSGNAQKYYKDNLNKYQEYRVQKYGLTIDQYDEMLTKQNYCCKLCKSELDMGKHTHIDHCHDTGEVRSILCAACNQALGLLKENVITMQRMIDYVNRGA